jgi:hypothetical protein
MANFFLVDQFVEPKVQGRHVFYQFVRPLLKADKYARFAIFGRAMVEEAEREERLA